MRLVSPCWGRGCPAAPRVRGHPWVPPGQGQWRGRGVRWAAGPQRPGGRRPALPLPPDPGVLPMAGVLGEQGQSCPPRPARAALGMGTLRGGQRCHTCEGDDVTQARPRRHVRAVPMSHGRGLDAAEAADACVPREPAAAPRCASPHGSPRCCPPTPGRGHPLPAAALLQCPQCPPVPPGRASVSPAAKDGRRQAGVEA